MPLQKQQLFTRFSRRTARLAGEPPTFFIAAALIILWAVSGPFFGFSETWQLVINTTTTIITFLMVFLIQSTQNTDTEALQLKLDELIRATKGAHNVLLDLEELNEEELDALRDEYKKIAKKSRQRLVQGKSDTITPNIDLDVEKKLK